MGRTVMMVDDDEPFLDELGEVLRSSGYETTAVSDPTTAMETAHEVRPDLILMDLKMPRKNGFELAFELRSQSGLANIPVIAMTGFFRHSKTPLMELSGIRKCLTKPLAPLDVIAAIEEALNPDPSAGMESRGHAKIHDRTLLLGRFDDLLMEMAGDIDLSTLSEMSAKLTRLKEYKECTWKSLHPLEFGGSHES